MRFAAAALLSVSLMTLPGYASAQTDQTLADIRQELSVLYVEIQKLKRELSTTGSATTNTGSGSVLERVSTIESELQRLTQQTEQLDFRIQRIVTDGTNRIGDLEFRLVELEGGDISQLGETTTLGGDAGTSTPAPAPSNTGSGGSSAQLAVGEGADFDAAQKALDDGQYRDAADRFAAFNAAYPGSPMAAQASLSQGKALDALGDTREAARAYLASFSADATGPVAPDALTELGAALGRLGQTDQACLTLGEVEIRFPQSGAVTRARQEMTNLGCT
ncbi:MAG: tol-pal system protein YbgF [Paracoccaceae bacterium]